MRIAVLLALAGLSASCAVPPPEAAAPPLPAAAVATPIPLIAPAPPIAAATPPPALVATAPPPSGVAYVPVGGLLWGMLAAPPPPGRLMLSNFSFEPVRVQAVLAAGQACAIADAAAVTEVTEFVVPSNGTRILPAPPGADICWRREAPPVAADNASVAPWSAWNRAFTAPGRYLDATL